MKFTRRKFLGGAGIAAVGVGASVVKISQNQNSEPTRCKGKPTSVEQSLADKSGYEDGFSYFQKNNTVRIVTTRNSDGPASFKTKSFDEWASIQCADMGISRVREVTANRLGNDEFGAGLTSSPEGSQSRSVVLNVVTTDGQADKSENPAPIDFTQFVRVAPRSVDATISLDDKTFSRSVAVFAKQLEPATAQ